MSDPLDADLESDVAASEDDDTLTYGATDAGVDMSRPCARPGCTNYLPLGVVRTQKYCTQHQPKKHKAKNLGGPAGPPPRSVTINMPKNTTNKADSDAAKVTAGAQQMLSLVATGLALVDPVCAKAILDAVPGISAQLGELSKYQPVLKKIFTPGEGTGEALAWVGLLLTTSPVIVAILAHHKLLKPDTVEKLGAIFATAATQEANDAASQ